MTVELILHSSIMDTDILKAVTKYYKNGWVKRTEICKNSHIFKEVIKYYEQYREGFIKLKGYKYIACLLLFDANIKMARKPRNI